MGHRGPGGLGRSVHFLWLCLHELQGHGRDAWGIRFLLEVEDILLRAQATHHLLSWTPKVCKVVAIWHILEVFWLCF